MVSITVGTFSNPAFAIEPMADLPGAAGQFRKVVAMLALIETESFLSGQRLNVLHAYHVRLSLSLALFLIPLARRGGFFSISFRDY